jgi:integrase
MTLALALWTGQRQGDLLTLPWSSYDGTHIRLRQSKSGPAVIVRVGRPLKALLDATKRCCPTILANTHGQLWTSDGFRTSWRKLCDKAQIAGLTFHDLRGSAVTRLSLAGASPQEIAGVTGHSLADVHAILDRHYLGERARLAEAAIRRLEWKEEGTQTVK